MPPTFQEAVTAFYAALNDVLAGDASTMEALWSHADDVTYMSPFGEILVGWGPVSASWQAQADAHLSGRVEPAELHHFSSDTLGVVVGFERGEVEMNGVRTPVDIRATSMFRVEDGRWAMIGHHTDPLG
jgi:ketosteroid isomerase-like protein